MGVGKITKRTVREVIEKIVDKGKMVNKTYLIKDKEAYIVEKSEIYGAHGIPIDIHTFTEELQQVLHDVGGRIIRNGIKPESAQRYARILIQRVNRDKGLSDIHKRRTRTDPIKVLGLSQNRLFQARLVYVPQYISYVQ